MTPDVAAKSLVDWIDGFDINKTGEYWAPRGPGCVLIPLAQTHSWHTDACSVILELLNPCWAPKTSSRHRCSYRGSR